MEDAFTDPQPNGMVTQSAPHESDGPASNVLSESSGIWAQGPKTVLTAEVDWTVGPVT